VCPSFVQARAARLRGAMTVRPDVQVDTSVLGNNRTIELGFEEGTFFPHWAQVAKGVHSEESFGVIRKPVFDVSDFLCVWGGCEPGTLVCDADNEISYAPPEFGPVDDLACEVGVDCRGVSRLGRGAFR